MGGMVTIVFQSTPSAWRETAQLSALEIAQQISIHSLRMEGDLLLRLIFVFLFQFQSTPSAWRETPGAASLYGSWGFQSTPSAWRETFGRYCGGIFHAISIHSLRMEGDLTEWRSRVTASNFNPLPPHGGRRLAAVFDKGNFTISIHSLRMEGDNRLMIKMAQDSYFNPLPPHGGRPLPPQLPCRSFLFQSTPSAWRETKQTGGHVHALPISIHSLRMEGDLCAIIKLQQRKGNFNPLPPHGGRPQRYGPSPATRAFQSTPSAWRETSRQCTRACFRKHFNPRPPHGGRPSKISSAKAGFYFNPLPPHGGRRYSSTDERAI